MASVDRWKPGPDGKPRWRARWRSPDGKSRSQVFARKIDATRHLTQVENAKLSGGYIEPKAGKVTVSKLGEKLLDTKTDPKTKSWYRTMLAHVNARWGDTPIGAVDHLDVQAWVEEMRGQGTGPDTVRGAHRVLHEIIGLALRARMVGYDPCLGVKLPKVERREMLFLSAEQVNLLADRLERTWPGYGWGLLVKFAAYSGCRAGENGGLRVKHLDILRHRTRITTARKTYGVDGPTKTGTSRWVDLPRQLCDELAAHLAGRDHGPEARVWTGERGGPLNHQWFYKHRFKPVVVDLSERGQLPTIEGEDDEDGLTLRFHDLRHTCVALLIGKGAQQYEVMEHLGHTNIQTTINTYGHLFPNVRERIRTALEDTWEEADALAV